MYFPTVEYVSKTIHRKGFGKIVKQLVKCDELTEVAYIFLFN